MRCSHSRWGMAPWRGWGGGGWKSHLIANKSQNTLKNCCFSFTFQTYRSSDRERDRESQQLKLSRPRDCSMDGLGQLCFLETCEASMHLSMGWDGYTVSFSKVVLRQGAVNKVFVGVFLMFLAFFHSKIWA